MIVLLSAVFFTVKLTVYSPALLYVCTGFLAVEYVSSPKFHFHAVGVPVLMSVNVTFRGSYPYFGVPQKSATGSVEAGGLDAEPDDGLDVITRGR